VPTYEYRCLSCEHQFERFQRMSDDPVKECEVCGEPVRRLLFPVAVHFKGNGFYSTDYAKKNAIGTAVTGGLLSATFIDLIFIPFFFVLVSRRFAGKKQPVLEPAAAGNAPESAQEKQVLAQPAATEVI